MNHYYFLRDHLGSVVAVISGDGQTVSDRYGYDPYGTKTYSSGTVAVPFGYAGGYTDSTGLIKFGTRYYDPLTARWTQLDPLGDGTSSLYAYAGDDPIDNTDPTGAVWAHVYWWGIMIDLSYGEAELLHVWIIAGASPFELYILIRMMFGGYVSWIALMLWTIVEIYGFIIWAMNSLRHSGVWIAVNQLAISAPTGGPITIGANGNWWGWITWGRFV